MSYFGGIRLFYVPSSYSSLLCESLGTIFHTVGVGNHLIQILRRRFFWNEWEDMFEIFLGGELTQHIVMANKKVHALAQVTTFLSL